MAGAVPAGRLPRGERVRKRREYETVQGGGRRVTTPHFVLLLHARDASGTPARLGVVASRKVGIAVVRNRAKRLVREAFRSTRELWMPGIDLVVIVRRPLENMKLVEVATEWRAAASHVQRRTEDARRDEERRRTTEAAPP